VRETGGYVLHDHCLAGTSSSADRPGADRDDICGLERSIALDGAALERAAGHQLKYTGRRVAHQPMERAGRPLQQIIQRDRASHPIEDRLNDAQRLGRPGTKP
jgi:hypothetical protein